MRFIFLIGSLTTGAALALGLTEIADFARVALGVAAVIGVAFLTWPRRRPCKVRVRGAHRVRWQTDRESERYTDAEVREFFLAL